MASSRAVLYGMAALAAIAVHGTVVALLWRPPAPPQIAPAVQVRLIERPAPVVASPVETEPTATAADVTPPEPPPARKPRPQSQHAPKSKPKPEPELQPAAEPTASAGPAPESPAPPAVSSLPGPPPAAPPAQEPELALYCPHRPPPRYPPAARRLGQGGVVELLVELSATGAMTDVALVESSGWASLDRAAITAVRGWRCKPARAGGVAVAASARQRIRFSLR